MKKVGQLIENKIRNISFFLKNHTQNVVDKLFPDSFLKNQNWAYPWGLYSFFIICQVESYQNILKLSCRPRAFTSCEAFLKINRGAELSLSLNNKLKLTIN